MVRPIIHNLVLDCVDRGDDTSGACLGDQLAGAFDFCTGISRHCLDTIPNSSFRKSLPTWRPPAPDMAQ